MDLGSELIGLRPLQNVTLGHPEVSVGVLDGPVDMSHACFDGARLRRLDTLIDSPAGIGPMSVHGTHVTSVIFGQPGTLVAGIAPGCQGVLGAVFEDAPDRRLSQLDLARAIEQAVQAGAHVINISGGESSSDGQAEGVLRKALRLCEDSNVLVVAAAGNDGCACLHVPAAIPSAISVGALGRNGTPLESSNWGDAYKANGILAPGENIIGAAPGGGTVTLSGSSFATAIVSALVALLISVQILNGRRPDPLAAGHALLASADPCYPPDSPDCHRYLVGKLNIPGAYASVLKDGRIAMTSYNTAEAQLTPAVFATPEAGVALSGADIHAACAEGLGEGQPAATTATTDRQAIETGVTAACAEMPVQSLAGLLPPAPLHLPEDTSPSGGNSGLTDRAVSPGLGIMARPRPDGVVPAGGCGCGNGEKSYVYSIGKVGFDFGTEAERDAFRQLMPRPQTGRPPVSVPPNPYDVVQLVTYLDDHPWDSTNLIWTLNLDLTPIYAIEAESAYADNVYGLLREALRNQALPTDDDNYVSQVSIPGILTNKTRRLFSGQIVPVVLAQPRGLSTWNETALVDAVIQAVVSEQENINQDDLRLTIHMLLDKVYYQFRNLGQTSADRALNYAGTNAFVFAEGIRDGLLSARVVPGADHRVVYTLDTIAVSKSPYCRIDSDCWDVQLTFFNPDNSRNARCVFQYTIDVSRTMPVSLAPTHHFLVAPSVTLVS